MLTRSLELDVVLPTSDVPAACILDVAVNAVIKLRRKPRKRKANVHRVSQFADVAATSVSSQICLSVQFSSANFLLLKTNESYNAI